MYANFPYINKFKNEIEVKQCLIDYFVADVDRVEEPARDKDVGWVVATNLAPAHLETASAQNVDLKNRIKLMNVVLIWSVLNAVPKWIANKKQNQ